MARGAVIALLIIAIGMGWLLTSMNFGGGIDWIYTIAIAAAGVVTFALSKFNKISFVIGSFLIICSIMSLVRQMKMIKSEIEVPVLVVAFGVLVLIASTPFIPMPQFVIDAKEAAKQSKAK
jgi:hypothetical protein